MKQFKSLGLTLIELVAIIALFAILGGVGTLKMLSFASDKRVSELEKVASQLELSIKDFHVNAILQGFDDKTLTNVPTSNGFTILSHLGYPLSWGGNNSAEIAENVSQFIGTKVIHEDLAGSNASNNDLIVIYGQEGRPGRMQLKIVPNVFYDSRTTVNCYTKYTILMNSKINEVSTETSEC